MSAPKNYTVRSMLTAKDEPAIQIYQRIREAGKQQQALAAKVVETNMAQLIIESEHDIEIHNKCKLIQAMLLLARNEHEVDMSMNRVAEIVKAMGLTYVCGGHHIAIHLPSQYNGMLNGERVAIITGTGMSWE